MDPELFIHETDEESESDYTEPNFEYKDWEKWSLESGSVVAELLRTVANINGHCMRYLTANIEG